MAKTAVPASIPHLNTLLYLILSNLLSYLSYSVSSPSYASSSLKEIYLQKPLAIGGVVFLSVFSCHGVGFRAKRAMIRC